jgi:hypothetical protein
MTRFCVLQFLLIWRTSGGATNEVQTASYYDTMYLRQRRYSGGALPKYSKLVAKYTE